MGEVGRRWRRTFHDEVVFSGLEEQGMRSVAAGGPGLVAVGNDGRRAAVWTSPDGVVWQRVAHDEAVFGGPGEHKEVRSVVAGGPGLVAVGRDWSEDAAAVWVSADGLDWQRAPHAPQTLGGAEMSSVAVGGPGLVAVGSDLDEDAAVVWVSADGLVWLRVPNCWQTSGHYGRTFGHGVMLSVAVGGPGLVAVGWDLSLFALPAVWVSDDRLDWRRVPHYRETFDYGVMRSVAVGGPGLVVVGIDETSDGAEVMDTAAAAVWVSADGLDWRRVPHDPQTVGGGEMVSVVAGGPGLVAVGRDYREGAAVVWVSP